MRNLKRALSLTLASVMLLGMMVVGTSAASFPDVTEKDNVEAIEVLAAVSVLQGYDDGQYHAENPVTRNQMATIICRMMGWRDGDYAGLNPFPDVPDWAANYVAACVTNGIINGRDDGRFHGDDQVNATEAASMMLRALGYTRMPVGAEWARAVAQQAAKINLFDGLNVGAYTALNRGDVAQLSLNTLQSTLVDVKDNTLNIEAGNGVSISGGQIDYVVRTAAYNSVMARAIKANNNPNSGGIDGTSGQTIELGEQVFGGDLKRTEPKDAFQNPAVRWSYKTKEIGVYAKNADLTYLKDVKLKDIYNDLGLSKTPDDLNFAVNGDTTTTAVDSNGDAVTAADLNSSENAKVGGRGAVTKVYYTEDNDGDITVDITVTEYYLAKAVEDYDSTDKEIDVEIKSNTVTLNSDTLKLADFPVISGMAKDEYLVVTVAYDGSTNYDVKSAAPATVVENVVVTAARNDDYVMAGEKYEYSDISEKDPSALGKSLMNTATGYDLNGDGYNLYLDPNGYVLGVEGYDAGVNLNNYLFVKEIGKGSFDSEVVAKVLFSDGTSKTVTVTKVDGADANYSSNFRPNNEDKEFYKFTTSGDNYKLTSVKATSETPTLNTDKVAQDKKGTSSSGNALLGDKLNPIDNETARYADNSTLFIAKDKVYTGVKNAPKVAAGNSPDGNVVYYLYGWETDNQNRLLWVYATNTGSVVTSIEDLVYIIDAKAAVKKDGDDTFYVYDVWKNGKKDTLEANDSGKGVGLYEVDTYTDGRADLGSPITASQANKFVVGTATNYSYNNNVLTATGVSPASFYLKDDVKVYTISGTTVKTVSPSYLTKKVADDGFTQAILVREKDEAGANVAVVYVVKPAAGGASVETIDPSSGTHTDIAQEIADAFTAGKNVKITSALTLNKALTVPANKTLTVDAGGVNTSTFGLTVAGTANITGDVTGTGGVTVNAGGSATVAGAVSKVNDVAATGSLTVTGAKTIGEVTDNHGTITASTGTITDVKTINDGTITADTVTTVTNAVKGTIVSTNAITEVKNITGVTNTVTINAPVVTVTNVTSGTVNFEKAITTKVTNITDGTVTFKDTVAQVDDITAGTVEFQKAVAKVLNISGGTVKVKVSAVLDTAATLGAATIQLTEATTVLTVGAAGNPAIDIGAATITGVAGAKITVVGTGVTVGANQLYTVSGSTYTAVTEDDQADAGDYTCADDGGTLKFGKA